MSDIRGQFRMSAGTFILDAAFTVPDHGITGVFGPSGSGKTTLLRCCAGLARARDAKFSIGEDTWQDEQRGIFVPVHARRVGYVFQDASLFPHLTVRDNVLYGHRRIPREERTIDPDQAIAWTKIAPLLDRTHGNLSGGECQRVAIARALACSPVLLLMDEPLASLDEKSRGELLPCLESLHRDLSIPILLVSHSLREITRLADSLLLLNAGRVTASGPVSAILPDLHAHAGFAQEDAFAILDGQVARHDEVYVLSEIATSFGPIWAALVPRAAGESIRIQIGARDVSIGKSVDRDSSILNQFKARIAGIIERPPANVLVVLHPPESDDATPVFSLITRKSFDHLGLAIGAQVYARVKGVSVVR